MSIRQNISRMRNRLATAEQELQIGQHVDMTPRMGALWSEVESFNHVRSESPTTTYTGGSISLDQTGLVWYAYLKLKDPLTWVSVFNFVFSSPPTIVVDVDTGGTVSATNQFDLDVVPVLADWEPTTLTWNNRPTDEGDKETMRHNVLLSTNIKDVASSGDVTYDITCPYLDVAAFWGVSGYFADTDKAIYGFSLQPSFVCVNDHTLEGAAISGYAGMI